MFWRSKPGDCIDRIDVAMEGDYARRIQIDVYRGPRVAGVRKKVVDALPLLLRHLRWTVYA